MLTMYASLFIENARVAVATGLVLDADGVIVRVTRYLKTGARKTGTRATAEDLGLQPDSPAELINRPLVVAYNGSWQNYFHWLTQTVFCAWAWTQSANEMGALFLTPPLNAFQLQTLHLAGVESTDHHEAKTDAKLATPLAVVMPDAFGPGALRPSPHMAEFARHISRQIPDAGDTPSRIYVSRRDSRRRPVENESEIETVLARHGFSIMTLTGVSFADQVRLFRNAEIVVGPHGAGLSNLIFCRPGAQVLELAPSTYANECFAGLSKICRLRHRVEIFLADDILRTRWRVDAQRVLRALGKP